MNRAIKFRGIRKDTGKWVYGLLTFMFGDYSIVKPENENIVYPVSNETVGQFTGLHDKNGKEIYEGDRISGATTYTLEVYINKGHTKMKFFDEHRHVVKQDFYQEEIDEEGMVIIGNIYEDGGLLNE